MASGRHFEACFGVEVPEPSKYMLRLLKSQLLSRSSEPGPLVLVVSPVNSKRPSSSSSSSGDHKSCNSPSPNPGDHWQSFEVPLGAKLNVYLSFVILWLQ